MRVFSIKRFAFVQRFRFMFFNQIFRCDGCGTEFVIKLTALLLKIKFNPKKTRSTKCFAFFVNGFYMPADRIFPFINAKNGLERSFIRLPLWRSDGHLKPVRWRSFAMLQWPAL